MTTQILEAGDWSLLLPDEWSADQVDDSIVIGDRDGVGTLEISELRKESGLFEAIDLEAIMDQALSWHAITLGSFTGWEASLIEEETAIREWALHAGGVMLYVTYSCDLPNRTLDDAAVDEILATLCYAAP